MKLKVHTVWYEQGLPKAWRQKLRFELGRAKVAELKVAMDVKCWLDQQDNPSVWVLVTSDVVINANIWVRGNGPLRSRSWPTQCVALGRWYANGTGVTMNVWSLREAPEHAQVLCTQALQESLRLFCEGAVPYLHHF